MSATATPVAVRRSVTMRRIRTAVPPTSQGQQAETEARLLAARRRNTAKNGYRGPLTRAELARLATR